MITLSTVQSSTQTIHITSNDHSFNCPIIYTDTIHITSNDHSFDCPIIYTDIYSHYFHRHLRQCLTKQGHCLIVMPYLLKIASHPWQFTSKPYKLTFTCSFSRSCTWVSNKTIQPFPNIEFFLNYGWINFKPHEGHFWFWILLSNLTNSR